MVQVQGPGGPWRARPGPGVHGRARAIPGELGQAAPRQMLVKYNTFPRSPDLTNIQPPPTSELRLLTRTPQSSQMNNPFACL